MKAKTTLVKTDCINYNKKEGYCEGLKYLFCADSRICPFYKSDKFYNEDGSKRVEEEALCKETN